MSEHGGHDMLPHMPSPSVWPATLGLGVTLLALGIIASVYLSVTGVALMALALGGWIQELRHGE